MKKLPKSAPVTFAAEAVQQQRRMRWNPIRDISPERVVNLIDSFEAGELRGFVMLADKVAASDDVVASVKPKREKSVSQLQYQILMTEKSEEAMDHKAALEDFYNNLTTVNAFDRNERGGAVRLFRQMMSAASLLYAVHHIVWQPDASRELKLPSGKVIPSLTAKFEFVPLQFFENTTGELRFIKDGIGLSGEVLTEDEWMITVGDGLMRAVVKGWLIKLFATNDWLNYSEKFGTPGVLGRCPHGKDTEAGRNFRQMVEEFGQDFAAVIYGDDGNGKIEFLEAKGGGDLPFPKLIEMVERKINALYRGNDLSTMSSKDGEGTGASLQGDETDILHNSDAEDISDAFNHYVDRVVLRHQFGVAHGKAYFKLIVPKREDAAKVLSLYERLTDRGVRFAISDVLERIGLAAADEGEDVLQPKARPTPGKPGQPEQPPAINSRDAGRLSKFFRKAEMVLGTAYAQALKPAGDAIAKTLRLPDEEFLLAMEALPAELVQIAANAGADAETAEAFSKILTAAFFNGATNEDEN